MSVETEQLLCLQLKELKKNWGKRKKCQKACESAHHLCAGYETFWLSILKNTKNRFAISSNFDYNYFHRFKLPFISCWICHWSLKHLGCLQNFVAYTITVRHFIKLLRNQICNLVIIPKIFLRYDSMITETSFANFPQSRKWFDKLPKLLFKNID